MFSEEATSEMSWPNEDKTENKEGIKFRKSDLRQERGKWYFQGDNKNWEWKWVALEQA